MHRTGSFVALLLLYATTTNAQDALRGKRLYLDAPRVVGSAAACVDCHGGLPGGAFGITRVANDPAGVERAVNSVPQMATFRGRLAAGNFVDLAAFIGNPAVPSPDLRVIVSAPAGGSTSGAAIDFGSVPPGASSAVATLRIVNLGQVSLQLTSPARLRGPNAEDFSIVATDCAAPSTLFAQQSCRIDVVFRPISGGGARAASTQIDHDWVEGTAAVPLLGTALAATTPGAVQPTGAAGGGGSTNPSTALFAFVLCALGVARHRRDARV